MMAWLLVISTGIQAGGAGLVVNEVQTDPHASNGDANGDGVSSTTQDEFFELYNDTGADLDVSGWTMSDGAALRHTFPANTLIKDGCGLVVFGGGTPTGDFGNSLVQTASTGGLGLNNGGDTITINDGNVDVINWTFSTVANDQSNVLSPEVTGNTLVGHANATGSAGALFSPGTLVDGSQFSGCDVLADVPPAVDSTDPDSDETGVAVDANITINFTEAVDATINAVTLECDAQAVIFTGLPSSGQSVVLDPQSDFNLGDQCTVTVVAAEVTDQDGNVDAMTSDHQFDFTVDDGVAPPLIINEFQADPDAANGDANGDGVVDTQDDEFVELYNTTGADLDVSGWTVADGNSVRHTFPQGSVVPANCSAVVFAGGTPTGGFGGALVQIASTGSIGLNNGGDDIIITDGQNTIISYTYGGEGGDNQSLTLDPDVTGQSFVKHSVASGSGGALFSPGTRIDGASFSGCSTSDVPPSVTSTQPTDGENNVAVDAQVVINFSEVIDATANAVSMSCDLNPVAFTGLPANDVDTLVLTPDSNLPDGAVCEVVVFAAQVTDNDAPFDHMSADHMFTFTVVSPPQLREIYEIQGSGLVSPYVGLTVITENNLVTALDVDGFFMQTPDARDDGDVDTSNALFVYTGSNPPVQVAVGDDIDVTGEVAEFFESTQIGFGSTIVINSSGNELPTPITFNDKFPPNDPTVPVCSTDQETAKFECMEGMLIDMPQGFISSAYASYFGANAADLLVRAGSERAFREPGIEHPGGGGSIPTFDGNPELMQVDIDALTLPLTTYSAGSEIAIEGILGFDFGEYEIWPKTLTVVQENVLPSAVRTAAADEITVASFNAYRLFNDVADSGIQDEYIATTQEYQTHLEKLSDYVVNSLKAPMIVALQEVENAVTLADLAARIQTDSGIQYQTELVEGNDRGGIDVAFLYRDNVNVSAITQHGKDTTFDFDGSLLHDRPPLQLSANVSVGQLNMDLELLVVHLRSRGSIDDVTDGHRVRLKRLTQANDVAAMIDTIQSNNPGRIVVTLGDFNAFQFTDGYVDVMGQIDGTAVQAENTLWSAPLFAANPLSQAVQTLPANEQYSYVYQGSAQALDNAVLNDVALLHYTDMAFARGNADAHIDFDSNLTDGLGLRSSDHDGLVMYFTVPDLDLIFKNGFED